MRPPPWCERSSVWRRLPSAGHVLTAGRSRRLSLEGDMTGDRWLTSFYRWVGRSIVRSIGLSLHPAHPFVVSCKLTRQVCFLCKRASLVLALTAIAVTGNRRRRVNSSAIPVAVVARCVQVSPESVWTGPQAALRKVSPRLTRPPFLYRPSVRKSIGMPIQVPSEAIGM